MEDLISIALKYNPESNDAPVIIAAGKSDLARTILKIAEKNSVPVVKDKYAARILSEMPVGTEIPEKLYDAIAAVFSFIQFLENRHKK